MNYNIYIFPIICLLSLLLSCSKDNNSTAIENKPIITYKIVDTDISGFYNNNSVITEPKIGESFYGQDANYSINPPSYTDNGDETITDNISGLMWEQNMGKKITYDQAFTKAKNSTLGAYTDWRVPSIKELYSLILFTGRVKGENAIDMFINTKYFHQPIGNISIGEREIDAQTWSSTQYVGQTMSADETVFGINFVDGRIKGYPKIKPSTKTANTMYFRMVRNNIEYGKNKFTDNGDGSISDLATGLMWQKSDDGITRNWKEALLYSENLELANFNDWRLPNAKELQSIVDYTRSPQTSNSPAIDPIFETTKINIQNGKTTRYPFFWTSTTHHDGNNPYKNAVYIAFGKGLGQINGELIDVHGAGCQRSDPKDGDINEYPQYFGPQGDLQSVFNNVRAVRTISQ